MNEFLINNIETKKAFLQNEHKKIIDILYNNGIKTGTLKKHDFVPHLSQCMTFSDIKEESGFDMEIVIICLSDLESMGFVMNVMKNPDKEYAYGITWLGLKYVELKNDKLETDIMQL